MRNRKKRKETKRNKEEKKKGKNKRIPFRVMRERKKWEEELKVRGDSEGTSNAL